jgi:DNA primase
MALGNIDLTPQLVQAVRDAVDIVDIASEHTRLRKTGRRHSGLCPIHREKTPSFSVDPDRGLFYCFGCGRGGDAIKLYMTLSGDDFPTAIESLAQRYGIPIPARKESGRSGYRKSGPDLSAPLDEAWKFFKHQLASSDQTLSYLEKRKVTTETIEQFGLGYAPDGWRNLVDTLHPKYPMSSLMAAGLVARSERSSKREYDRFRNRLMFPIRSASGRLVGFGGRTLGDDRAKYINTSETEQFQKAYLLYGLDLAKRQIRESGSVLLVEGYFDVIGAALTGIDFAVASMGTSLTPQQAKLLARFAGEVIVGYDGDSAGEQAYRRALPVLLAQGLSVRRAQFGQDQDPDSLRLAEGPEAVRAAVESAEDGVELELIRLAPKEVHTNPRAQSVAARRIGELLSSIPDSVLRYSYARQAADRLGVPTELIWNRLSRGENSPPPSDEGGISTKNVVRSLEESVLQLLLAEDQEAPSADELPPAEVFMIPVCRNIYRVFSDLYINRAGIKPTAQEVLAGVPFDGDEVDQVARLLLEGSLDLRIGDLEPALEKLRRRWLQQRLRELASQISDAQRSGDEALLQRLVQEKTGLSQDLHRSRAEERVPE